MRCTALAYRNALNHTSTVAFVGGKISQGKKLQRLVSQDLRERLVLPAQMACNVPRQVAAAYKTLWERSKAGATHKLKAGSARRYKGLDKAPRFTAITMTLNHCQDWSLGKEQTVSMGTFGGGIRCRYEGWNRHLEWMARAQGAWRHTGRGPTLAGPCIQGMVSAGVRRKGFEPEPAGLHHHGQGCGHEPPEHRGGIQCPRQMSFLSWWTPKAPDQACRQYTKCDASEGHSRSQSGFAVIGATRKTAERRHGALCEQGHRGAPRDGWHGVAEGYLSSNRAQTVGEGKRKAPQGEHLGFCGGASQDGLQNPAVERSAGLGGCGLHQPETPGLRACWAGESAQ